MDRIYRISEDSQESDSLVLLPHRRCSWTASQLSEPQTENKEILSILLIDPANPVRSFFRVVVDRLDALDTAQALAVGKADESHALGVAAIDGNVGNGGAHQRAGIGDQHDLVVVTDQLRADDLAVALVGLDGDHALAAAALQRVFGDRGALAVAVLGSGQHAAFLAHDDEVSDDLALRKANATHAGGIAAHGAHVLLVEADALAVRGLQEHVALAVGQRHAD